MSLFLIIFFTLYGGLHIYAFISIKRAFQPGQFWLFAITGWMAAMTVAPLIVRIAEHADFIRIARVIAWPGFSWMGFIFILVSALLTLDILRLITFLLMRVRGAAVPRILSPRVTCGIALLYAGAATIYGFYEAGNIRSEYVTVSTNKLPPSVSRVRVVQISDVHLGLIIREERLKQMIRVIEKAKPDILVSTGDLLDGRLSRQDKSSSYDRMAILLAAVSAPLGKFAVMGNHEFYAGLDQSLAITRSTGFRTLRNESVDLTCGISVSGIDDPAWQRFGRKPSGTPEPELLKGLTTENFHLNLKHRPEVGPDYDRLIDLQLSGHTHCGQIFPFYLLTKLDYPIPSGTTRTGHGALVHVSRGTGTWGPPIRFLAPPEITVIDIIPAAATPLTSPSS